MGKQKTRRDENGSQKIRYKRRWKKNLAGLLAASFIFSISPSISYAAGHAINFNTMEFALPINNTTDFEVKELKETDLEGLETFQMPNARSITINPYASDYGRNWLGQYYNNNLKKEEAKGLYDAISTYITAFQESSSDAQLNGNYYYFNKKLDINSIGENFSVKELEMIYTIVLYDHPEFYVTEGIFYTTDYAGNVKNMVVNCTADYANGTVRTALNKEIQENIQRYLDMVSGLKTDLEKEMAIHNKMLEELTYGYENSQPSNQPYAHSIVSVFDYNKNTMPVCEGYAKAFQLLLNAVGIENLFVTGTLNGVGHAWNIVNLDGNYYYADITQDDSRYDTIEKSCIEKGISASYTPEGVVEWAQGQGIHWENGEECTEENTLYYYFNKGKSTFAKDYRVNGVFNIDGNTIKEEQYTLPDIAENNYSNTTQKADSHFILYDNSNNGELMIYNNGVEVKSRTKVLEGTVLTVKFKPLDNSKVYSIYEGMNLVQTTKENNEYTGSFILGSLDTTITIQAKEPEVTGVSLNSTSLSFSKIGDTAQLRATVLPAAAKNQKVSWKSSNSAVAVVDENGLIKTIANGTAIITVTTEEGAKTASCEITVDTTKPEVPVAVESVKLNNPTINFSKIGETSQLTAAITPANATNQRVSWNSDNGKVAAVDNTGKVTAVGNGTAHITVITDDGKKKAVSAITVDTKGTPVTVTDIQLDRTQMKISAIPATDHLNAVIIPSNATNQNIKWTSSNPTIAIVNNLGEVTSVSNGTAIITVTSEDGQKTANCTVTVDTVNVPSEVKVTGVGLNKTQVTLTRKGATETLKATIYPTNASNKKVKWKTDKTTVATVDSDGTITAVRTGTAHITATTEDGKYVGTCVVTVNASSSSSSRPGSNNSSSRPSSNNSNTNHPGNNTAPITKNVWESNAAGWRYKDSSGNYAKDTWSLINGKWYYFGASTYMQKGWLLDKTGKWYYLDTTSGEMKTDWQKVNNKWYYFDTQNGQMKTGWKKVKDKWYFMDKKSGEMKIGWIWVENKWYYLKQDGSMLTGWQKINGKWYYLAASGECLMNTTTPDGKKVDKNGVWIP